MYEYGKELAEQSSSIEELQDALRNEIESILDQVADYLNGGDAFTQQLTYGCTDQVDVDELVEHFTENYKEFIQSENEDNDYDASAKKSTVKSFKDSVDSIRKSTYKKIGKV